jgi:hypothetical protein
MRKKSLVAHGPHGAARSLYRIEGFALKYVLEQFAHGVFDLAIRTPVHQPRDLPGRSAAPDAGFSIWK